MTERVDYANLNINQYGQLKTQAKNVSTDRNSLNKVNTRMTTSPNVSKNVKNKNQELFTKKVVKNVKNSSIVQKSPLKK